MKNIKLIIIILFVSISYISITIAAPNPPLPPFPPGDISSCPDWKVQSDQLNKNSSGFLTVKKNGDYNHVIPENSMEAFDLSYRGCRPAIEIPVQLTKDRRLVVFNDSYLERMTDKTFNPELRQNLREKVSDTTLAYIQKLSLININKEVTKYRIPTFNEFIEDYLQKKTGTLIYVKTTDPEALLAAIITLDKLIIKKKDSTLASRFIFKVNIEDVLSPEILSLELQNFWVINYKSMNFNPVLTKKTFNQLNREGNDLAARYVIERWVDHPDIKVPVVDLEFTQDDQPATNGSMSTIASLLAFTYKKRIGAFVPISDYPLWRQTLASGYTVNNTDDYKKPIDVTLANYNKDGTCCHSHKIRTDGKDMRTDIKWLLTSTKSSVITSLDVDSIENYSPTKILINNKARPKMSYPPYQMKSSLSWELGFYKKPNGSSVSLKAVGDSISNDWRNGVCLYSKENSVGVAYSCNDDNIQGWGFNKQLVVRMADDNSMYIQDPATKLCLTGNSDHNQGITYWAECHESSQWIRYGDNTFENKVFANTYLSFNVDGEWKGSRFGLVKNDGFSNYKYWKMESSQNRWSIYD
ncbi:hypothetical protein E2751_10190 [Salmonella enterica]|nr:hypothetical protein [Salmonella enterica]